MQIVVAGIIEREGKVLIARRKEGKRLGGRWEFPGGKVEPGETPEECLTRELGEELGITAEAGGLLCESECSYSWGHMKLLAYETSWICGTLELRDHTAIAWELPSNLSSRDLVDADLPVARLLAERQTRST